ncbi:hypothetical protein ACFP1Z_33305 [Streptomyces gamaensis]|uniref:Uncharacterized protein n=1 Tax=Streptomyces gamaensis TaxID=1763542 RepID=A0ABW0Z864_9ACTN
MSLEFRLEWEWLDAPHTSARELGATWARLRIAVGGETVTLVQEPATRTFREHTVGSLYPLAEWVAFNWFSLVADARPGTQISQLRFAYRHGVGDDRGSWWVRSRRHILRAACDGFHWPDLLVVPEGRQTRVVWMPDMGPDVRPGNRFAGRGNAVVGSEQFAAALASFVDATVARLRRAGIEDTPLQEEWSGVRRTEEDAEEAAFCRAAARLGLDPYAEAAPYEDAIARAVKELPDPLATDFLNGVGPDRITDQLRWVARARELMGRAPADAAPSPELAELRRACADLSERFFAPGALDDPWQLGYEVAHRVRAWAGLDDTAPFDPSPLMTYRTEQVPYRDRGLVALGTLSGRDGAALVSSRRFTDRPRRFLQARALWHLVCDVDDTFLIAAAHTHRQHVARGFALEVLAPAEGVATLLADPAHLVSAEDVELIADDYGVGNIVVEHQLDNRVLARDFTWPGRRGPGTRRVRGGAA